MTPVPTPTLPPALQHCLQAATRVPDTPTLELWLAQWRALVGSQPTPIAQALLGGFQADRLAWAFAAGYQAAMHQLLPGNAAHETPGALLAMCLSEAGGNRPRDLLTRATPQADGTWLLHGDKSWATFGADCSELLVIALRDDGQTGDRPHLCALRVPANTPGVHLDTRPATTLVPELPHAVLALRSVRLPSTALLPGDGFADYGKPFRTLEDTLVTAATLAWLLREARARDWPAALREQLTAALALLCTLDAAAASATAHGAVPELAAARATGHLALAGALHWARQLYDQAGARWAAAGDDPAAQRWQRDANLLGVAAQARRLRAEAAWAKLAGPLEAEAG